MEWHGGHLESQPGHNERQSHQQRRVEGRRLESKDRLYLREPGRAQHPVHLADAVEEQRRGEGPQQYVLDPGLVGLGVVPPEGDQHVKAEAEQLKGDVGGEQLPRGSHQHHPQYGEEQNAVVLAGMAQVLLHVVD